jgi:hypothetical protein
MIEMLEQDKRFISNTVNELREKAQALEKFAKNNDVLGIWLTAIRLDVLVDHLNDFVEKKRKEGVCDEG